MMSRLSVTWSVMLALAVNAVIVTLLFLIIPREIREKVLHTVVDVTISDYRLPELEEDIPYEPPQNESDAASEGAENTSAGSSGRGTSSSGSGSGGGGAFSERIYSESLGSFAPELMTHAVKNGPGHAESRAAVDEIMQQMELFSGSNSITAPVSGNGKSALPPGHVISTSFKGRIGKAGRRAALKKHGGDEKSEGAVEKALKYLASKQNPDGSWGSEESFQTGDIVALSGLSVLAFLSHGETYDSPAYGKTVQSGVNLLKRLAEIGGIEYAGKGFGHAILTYSLAESYAMTGDLSLKKPLEDRVKAIIVRQNKYGSFAENYDNKPAATPPPSESDDPRWKEIIVGEPVCDLSLLGWHVQALTAAKNAGIRVNKLDETLNKALEALVRIHQAKHGGFTSGINMKRFEADGNMNSVGLLCVQLLNSGKSSVGKRAERLVIPDKKDALPRWNEAGGFPLYRWYYQTQSIFQSTRGMADRWKRWNENMKKEMLENQMESGAWKLPAGDNSFKLKNGDDLSIYATSISSLILQVYYRYLPSYSIAEAGKSGASFADQLEKGAGGYIRRLPGDADPLADLILGIGSRSMKPVRFGAFDNRVKGVETPHIPERFKIYSSLKSTINVREERDWPQTLQPKQKIAVSLDEFLPEDFRNDLLFSVAFINGLNENHTIPSIEVRLNGNRIYYSSFCTGKTLLNLLIPKKYIQPSGNILLISNKGEISFAFDGAELKEAALAGPRIYLGCDDLDDVPAFFRPCFNIFHIFRGEDQPVQQLRNKITLAHQSGAIPLLSMESSYQKGSLSSEDMKRNAFFEIFPADSGETPFSMDELPAQTDSRNKIIVRESLSTRDLPAVKSYRLSSLELDKQLFEVAQGTYSPDRENWGIWNSYGHEDMGNEFQMYYLVKTGCEIIGWLASGGSGVVLSDVMSGGQFFDTVYKTPYPPASALIQMSKLFDGNPRKLPCTIYPDGDTPLLFTYAAAAANAPGVVTIVVAKRFAEDSGITLHTLVPWNGKTKMVIERGFFNEKSPYAEMYGALMREESEVIIENNAFEYSSGFGELTVIRLSQYFSGELKKPVADTSYNPEIEVTPIMAEASGLEIPKEFDFVSLRDPGGHAAVMGNRASFSVIPASTDTREKDPFKPEEKESVEISFTTGNKLKRYDSVFLSLGAGCDNASALTFTVYPKMSLSKANNQLKNVPMIFSFSGKLFRTSFQPDCWYRVTVPLTEDTPAPNWRELRIIEPRNILDSSSKSISYEINHIGLLVKQEEGAKK